LLIALSGFGASQLTLRSWRGYKPQFASFKGSLLGPTRIVRRENGIFMSINPQVKNYWEQEACGTGSYATGELEGKSKEWYEAVENYRYQMEPFIHSVAQFTRHHGKTVLEVGVGAGTDHLQWARAGCNLFGVDLTDEAIATTKRRFELYGQKSNLQRVDAEKLPFADGFFDVVYSWGVIHHSQNPESIIAEIHRVLKKGGMFIGMMYGRYSVDVLKLWVKHGLLKGRPFRTPSALVWNHVESIGTKAYTVREIKDLLGLFESKEAFKILTPYDTKYIPQPIARLLPNGLGWFIAFRAVK